MTDCSFLCQCAKCRAHFEITGTRQNGTVTLEPDNRIMLVNGTLRDRGCGGNIEFYTWKPEDIGVKIIYPEEKRPRGRPKIPAVFEAKT